MDFHINLLYNIIVETYKNFSTIIANLPKVRDAKLKGL